MKKAIWISVLFTLFSPLQSRAQQLTPFVISTSGGFYSNGSGMLSFTTGELAAVETYTGPSAILTQGFQQPWDLGTYIHEHPLTGFSFGFYPNPTDGNFYVLTDTELNLEVEVAISDVLGKNVLHTSFNPAGKINIHPLDITFAPPGAYIISLRVKDASSGAEHVFVRKITLVK